MILRQWAAHGRLPTYDQLDSDNRFLGMSMAYLSGSAYLEWLELRNGEGSLRRVWTRMTADRRRTFDAAFAGVFGESPERLYGEFTAALTAAAVGLLTVYDMVKAVDRGMVLQDLRLEEKRGGKSGVYRRGA